MKKILTFCALFFSTVLLAQPLNKIVVFGDSLSDNGNFYHYMKEQFPRAPYYEGRFSNGPVWIEYIAEENQVELDDYAFGGAGILAPDADEESALFNLKQEVSSYLLSHGDKAEENTLYVMWIGANNYLAIPQDGEEALYVVLTGIQTQLERLAERGAKNFLVLNLPDLGVTPAATEAEASELLTKLTLEHNTRLTQMIDGFRSQYSDSKWVYVNIGELFQDLFQHPEQYGISPEVLYDYCYDKYTAMPLKNISMLKVAASIKPLAAGEQADPCDGYLFFDLVHPTGHAHRVLADKASEILVQSGVEFAKSAA